MGKLFYLLFILSPVLSIQPSAFAYSERPYEGSSSVKFDFSSVFDAHDSSEANRLTPSIDESSIQYALDDVDHRISSEFHLPEELRHQVTFWFRIYTQFTTQHVAVFDEKHPEVIYEVLDFRDLAKQARNAVVYEIVRETKIRSTLASYRKAFARLAKGNRTGFYEQRVLSALKVARHRHPYLSLASTIKVQTGQRDNIVNGLALADAYFPKMEAIFSSLGVPPQLTRLVLVESSFNSSAISRVGATGVWQFMERSAKEFMLVRPDLGVDERLSALKSTAAAARLLGRNYRILKDWGLSIVSYNSGVRPVLAPSRVVSRDSIAKRVFDSCGGSRALGFAGKSYYPGFLALLHAEAYRERFYGRSTNAPEPNVRFVQLTQADTLFQFGFKNSLSLHQLLRINLDVKNPKTKLPAGFWVAIPANEHSDFSGLIAAPSKQLQKKTRLKAARKAIVTARR